MIMRAVVAASVLAVTPYGAFSQSAAAPAFEVASIKPNLSSKAGGEGSRRENVEPGPASLTLRNVSLKSCAKWAYNVQELQVSGPDWLDDERFDIVARAAGAVPEAQLRLMLQTLLTDRFKMATHREEKVLSVYALVVGKNGPKIHQSEGNLPTELKLGKMTATATNVPLSQFTELLSGPLRTPVVDMTGLTGKFDFNVDLTKYLPTEGEGKGKGQEDRPEPSYVLSMALQEQLGLKIESRKAPVQMLVIDRAEKLPTEN